MRALQFPGITMIRPLLLSVCVWSGVAGVAEAQQEPVPAYLAVVEGNATLQREGEVVTAEPNMPFVQGDRLRTQDGRVQIVFPDGSAIEVAENSEVECISPTRVRLLAGTMDRVQRAIGGSQSATHLPPELDVYGGTFDQYGTWQYDTPYGYVWYPTVAAGWQPYYYGYWAPVPRYGYTWIGADLWAWPTHHYGRWGFARNRWFWIPGRTWGPAWVSWASAPGYVSWCPLGFDGRPVFPFSYGFGRSWAGWPILPRANFGAFRYYAHRNAVDPRRIPANAAFVARTGPPAPPAARVGRANVNNGPTVGVAVPRYPRQSSVASRQMPVTPRQVQGNPEQSRGVGSPQSTVGSPQSPAGALQSVSPQAPAGRLQPQVGTRPSPVRVPQSSPVGVPQSSAVGVPRSSPVGVPRSSPVGTPQSSPVGSLESTGRGAGPTIIRPGPAAGQPPRGERRPLPQTRYGMPRPMSPTASPSPTVSSPTLVPDSRPAAPAYHPAIPGQQSPNERRIQPMVPRMPSAERAPMAVPRNTPNAPAAQPPPQAAPSGAPPAHARPAPNAAPQGDGQARGQGQGRGRPR